MTVKPTLKISTPASLAPLLQQRFNSLNIPLDHIVLDAIAHFHPSQVQAALNHVEANFELINSPKAVFLYQLPRQPIEENKPLLPVFTARDFPGYTLQHLKSMCPVSWQSAAHHFGIPLS
jgi:hypothetical protein